MERSKNMFVIFVCRLSFRENRFQSKRGQNFTFKTLKALFIMAFMGDMMSPAPLWHNGPAPGAFYNFPGNATNIGINHHAVQQFKAQ